MGRIGCLLALVAALMAALPAVADDAPDRWPGRTEFWRQVRQGFEGEVNQHDRGVLIEGQHKAWQSVHTGFVVTYGKQLLLVTAIAIGAIGVFGARGRRAAVRLRRGVVWFGRIDRLAYGLTALSFLALGATGLVILYGRHMLAPVLGREMFAQLAFVSKYVHDRVSWAFIIAVALLVLVWLRDRARGAWKPPVASPPGIAGPLLFWSVVFGGVVVSYSGITMLFPLVLVEARRMPLMQIVHSLSSLTLAALIFAHVFFAAVILRENTRKLTEAKEELERRVEERTRELEAARRRAEEADRAKGRFLAAASHDLLQPLSAARLMIATLKHQGGGENGELLETVQVALSSAEDMLSDLLDIAKLDGRCATPRIEPVVAGDLLMALRAEFQPLAHKAGLRFDVLDCRLVVASDAHLLGRVLRNLISNAIRYTRTGRVLVGCRRRAGLLRFEVWDTGIGISAENLDRIFHEFHREGEAASLHQRGTGLGLAIVKRIAHMLDHPLDVRSVPRRGSLFATTVPLTDAPSPKPMVTPDSRADVAGLTVLVVDNDPEVLHATAALLTAWRCEVIACRSRQDVRACRRAPDLIVADYHLDDSLGLEAIADLRAAWPGLPALVVTADRSEDVRHRITTCGLAMLYKPVKPAKLRALMAHLARH